MITRTLNPEIHVLDADRGLIEYRASDETVDHCREVIRADGWQFNFLEKNAPFLDSHNYSSIENVLGRIVDAKVIRRRLIETVEWAVNVPENKAAALGFKMTAAGFLRSVSVGFKPIEVVTTEDSKQWREQLVDLGINENEAPRLIYTKQEQLELSACVLGMNPNCVALAYKAGLLHESELDFLSQETSRANAQLAVSPGGANWARRRGSRGYARSYELMTRAEFLREFEAIINRL